MTTPKDKPAELPAVTDAVASATIQAMQDARQRVPGDIVNRATADLPDNQRSAIRRFHAYYIEHDLSIAEAAKLIRVAGSTLSLILNGHYPAKVDNVVAEIEGFFELSDRRSQSKKLNFIHTKLTQRIWGVCDAALEFNKIAFIWGDGQIGKTEALRAYQAAHNHGSTLYLEVPTGGTLQDFLISMAEKLRIINSFDDRMVLIVDELHRTVDRQAGRPSIRTIEFIRELYNERQPGIVLCGTNVFRDEMDSGDLERILRQLKRRRLCALQLPNVPSREDLNTFAAAYGLAASAGDARKLEADMVEHEALGMWLTLLRMAAKLAATRKQKLEWAHVISANAGLQALEGKSTAK